MSQPRIHGTLTGCRKPRRCWLAWTLLCAAFAAVLLPAAPGAQGQLASTSPIPSSTTNPAVEDAALSGTVADADGALVPGALLSLANTATGVVHTERAANGGSYRFTHLPPGTYVLTVTAFGFETYTSPPFALSTGERRTAFAVSLLIPANHADVTVNLSTHQLAAEEIHAAERQRVLGIFPNFYTSFVPNPAPMDAKQKFGLAFHATLDPVAFATAALVASGEQIKGTFPEYGGGTIGYAKRYGAALADGFDGKIIGAGILPSVFRQDPRYFYMGTGTVRQRALHAVASAVLARGDRSGRWQPNYSHILGNIAAGALSATYHPASDSAGKLALDNALLGTLGEAGVNLAREFLLKHFTHGVPAATAVP